MVFTQNGRIEGHWNSRHLQYSILSILIKINSFSFCFYFILISLQLHTNASAILCKRHFSDGNGKSNGNDDGKCERTTKWRRHG